MGCLVLNENVQNTVLDYLENKSESYVERNPYAYDPKAKYSPATLVNEWYEDRQQELPPQFHLKLTTEYMDNYQKLCKYSVPDRKDYFKMVFDSQGLGQEVLMDHLGQSYYNNFTTMYDLCYNHLVKGLCGPFPRKYAKGKYLPETDTTMIYGNLTQWGIREKVIKKAEPYCRPLPPAPEYRSEFIRHDRAEVKRLNDFQFRGRKKTDLLMAGDRR